MRQDDHHLKIENCAGTRPTRRSRWAPANPRWARTWTSTPSSRSQSATVRAASVVDQGGGAFGLTGSTFTIPMLMMRMAPRTHAHTCLRTNACISINRRGRHPSRLWVSFRARGLRQRLQGEWHHVRGAHSPPTEHLRRQDQGSCCFGVGLCRRTRSVSGLAFQTTPPIHHHTTCRKQTKKQQARELAIRVGVPVVPGTDGPVSTLEEARAFIDSGVGYPVIIKARVSAGRALVVGALAFEAGWVGQNV